MEIRLAKIDDLDSLMEITRRCIENLDNNSVYQWDEIYPSREDFHGDIVEQTLYVITHDSTGSVGGCICINEVEYPGYENADWTGSDFFVIHKMIVDPLYENRGYGKFAMNFAEEISDSRKKDSLRLDCFQKNVRANKFYQSCEYTIKGETLFRKGMFNLYEKVIYRTEKRK